MINELKFNYINPSIPLFFSLCVLIISSSLLAQDTWEHVYDPYPSADGYHREDVIKCSDGGYAFCGGCFWEDPENPGFYVASFGITVKVDENGILEWIEQDTLYLDAGIFMGLAEMSDGGIVTAVGPKVDLSSTLVKRDAQGSILWQVNPGFPINSLIDSEDGGIIAVGYAQNNMKKFSSAGNLLWEKRINAYTLFSVEKTSDGGYITSGCYNEQNYGDVVVAKTNANGDTLWTKYLDGFNTTDEGKCVFETSTNEIIVVGRFDYGYGFIWKLGQNGNTLNLEIIDQSISWQIWCAKEYLNESIITWGNSPEFIWRFNRFDSEFNYIDSMRDNASFCGDKGFLVDENYLIYLQWPNLTVTKTLYQPVDVEENILPETEYISMMNYPNPFNPTTTISFNLTTENTESTELIIYNLRGQKIKKLEIKNLKLGINKVEWNGTDQNNQPVASGIYFYKLKSGDIEISRKMLLLK